jgi:1,4-dihydroxy-2-naphthoate octaprenyltransferase
LGSKLTLRHKFIQSLRGIFKIADFAGWQKWSGAAFLGFAFALEMGNNFSLNQFQGLLIGVPLICCYNQAVNDCFDVENSWQEVNSHKIDIEKSGIGGNFFISIGWTFIRLVCLGGSFCFLLFCSGSGDALLSPTL